MELSIFNEYDNAHEVLDHRINNNGDYEYLVKLTTTLVELEPQYIDRRDYENNMYYIWILDNFSLFEVSLSSTYTRNTNFFSTLIELFLSYRKSSSIKVMYCNMNNVIISPKNIDTIKYLKTIYPSYQFIHNVGYHTVHKWNVFKHLKVGDMLYYENLTPCYISSHEFLTTLSRLAAMHITNRLNFSYALVDCVEEFSKFGVNIIDRDYLDKRKEKILAITSATHHKIGKDSTLRILQPHMLRRISLWL
jgi:hypothetical protein